MTRTAPQRTTTIGWMPLAVLATAQFLVVLSTSIVNVALPQIRAGLDLSDTGQAWTVNAYVLVFGALLLPGGRAGDVHGLRRVFLLGTGLFALASLSAALAPTTAVLIAARAVQGTGAALLAPTALALVLTLYPDRERRGTALGVWGAVSGAGGAAGVLLSGLLTSLYGWRAVFVVMVPLALAVLVATRLLVEADRPRGGSLDAPGAVTLTAGLGALAHGLSGPWPLAVLGLALLGLFAVVQRRAAEPLLPPRMRAVAAPNVLMALLGAVWLGLFYFLPLYQQRDLDYSPLEAGLTQLPLALMITLSSWATGRLSGRAVLPAGLLVLGAGLAWLARTPADGTFLVDLLGPTLLVGSGLGVAFVRLTALASTGVAAADNGLAGGLVNATRQIGGAVGLSFLTLLPSFGAAFLACAALTLLLCALSVLLTRKA
ncbi:MFS transporter [Streptomyces spectabilis]|uniref:EmrB/QacA subfamily drug resistance transporter n=1 Tax=Streptomyces spectabilis TaxID=68270 RepID=A0A5P2X576_STRST|nr:MFS transporter [Streptomyces spectabilis]MBB5101447.1 EmrB/QacA subfamily drug resistance transporter [Streptomyces spectabilis]MCI3900639.1 MFS transporter [Streptomyces spectabilis]QEV58190.1 MFS transporter [Streptomyces spectabilis]GGV11479.1 MFS transporter [Streptomyces spectabilis]